MKNYFFFLHCTAKLIWNVWTRAAEIKTIKIYVIYYTSFSFFVSEFLSCVFSMDYSGVVLPVAVRVMKSRRWMKARQPCLGWGNAALEMIILVMLVSVSRLCCFVSDTREQFVANTDVPIFFISISDYGYSLFSIEMIAEILIAKIVIIYHSTLEYHYAEITLKNIVPNNIFGIEGMLPLMVEFEPSFSHSLYC